MIRLSASTCRSGLAAGVFLLIVLPVVAIATPAGVAKDAVGVSVLEDAQDRIVLHFAFGDYRSQKVMIDGQEFEELRLPSEPVTREKGAPQLPRVCRSVIIPDDAEMAVNVLGQRYYEVSARVASSKGVLPRSIDPDSVPYTFGPAYDTDAFYPGPVALLQDPYIMRDYRGVTVMLNPFQYNPVTRVLRVYTELTVEVVAVGPARINAFQPPAREKTLSRPFHEIYTAHFLNYDMEGRYDPLDEEGDMLVICYDAWLPNIQPLVEHKNSIGISTTAVGVSTIGNNATAIKNYIQGVYDTSDLAFVLLVGDAAQVATPSAVGGASDPTYSKLAGNDYYPEIIVGRFSAENTGQVDTQVERTIEYENMPATEQDWFWRGMGVASNLGPGDDGEDDNEHIDNIRDDLLAYGYTHVDQIYDPYANAGMVSDGLNAGRGIVNYCGHGGPTGWSTTGFSNSHVNALVNDNMLPFIVSVACNNGEFDNYTCFAEAWLRATHGGEPSGAVGCYASSVSHPWNPPMEGQDEFNLLYCAESYHSYGALCYAGSCSMMDDYPGNDQTWGTGPATFNTWHIFGDPSLRVVGTVAPPTGMRVTPGSGLAAEGPRGGPFEPEHIVYTLENFDDTGLDYVVTKTQSWVSIDNASGYLPPHQTTTVTVSINDGANGLGNGHYEDTVEFINTTNHDGDTTRPVTLDVGVPTVQYDWVLDSDPGWSTQGLWAFGQPTGGGGQYGGPDPTSGHTGPYVYGYNLYGDYEDYLPERHLTTDAIDCSELTQVSLKFWRWLGVEQPAYDHAYVRVSTNGSNWTTVWQNGSEITDYSWQHQEFDIADIADSQPTVYLRWTMGSTDGGWRYCGWNVDDIEIWGVAPSEVPGDLDGDGDVDQQDLGILLADYGCTGGDCPGDCDGDGDTDQADLGILLANWGYGT